MTRMSPAASWAGEVDKATWQWLEGLLPTSGGSEAAWADQRVRLLPSWRGAELSGGTRAGFPGLPPALPTGH